VPLSGFILLTFALAAEAERRESDPRWWALAGLASGLAGWTKNEGLVSLVMTSAMVVAWIAWRVVRMDRASPSRARLAGPAAFFLGAAPLIVVIAAFKWGFTPGNDVLSGQTTSATLARVLDPGRLAIVGEAFARELWYGGAATIGVLPVLAVYIAVRGVRRPIDPAVTFAAAVIFVSLIAYASIYAMIQYDLFWSLQTTLDRLILQLTPSMLWIGLMWAR
jgi:hypothetical protein